MDQVIGLVVVVLLLIGLWQLHVHFYPWKDCPRCSAKKRNYSLRAHRDCGRCGSTGRVRRIGAPREER